MVRIMREKDATMGYFDGKGGDIGHELAVVKDIPKAHGLWLKQNPRCQCGKPGTHALMTTKNAVLDIVCKKCGEHRVRKQI